MRFSPRDIVLVPFPFTHFDSDKIRPAIIINKRNPYGDHVVLFLTSQVDKYKKYKENILIKKSSVNNLLVDSMIITSKFATLSDAMMYEKIGNLTEMEWNKLKKQIKLVLGI